MKHQLLVGGLMLSVFAITAQNQKTVNPQNSAGASLNELKIRSISPRAVAIKRAGQALNTSGAKVNGTTEINSSPLSSGTWTNISSSMNIYGVFNSNSRPLQYNPNVKAISFVQRKSEYYTANPADNSGAIVAMISSNGGISWDSTCFYSDATYPGRYPQGAIYSAPGNTNIANAYIVGSGPVLGGGGFGGSFFASKQLGTGNYNSSASSAPGAMQVMTNFAPYPSFGRFDYASYGFTSTDDGVVRSMGVICDDFNNLTDVWGYMLVKGTFNAGAFTWTGDSINPPVALRSDGTRHMNFTPMTAWSQDGTIGYVVTIGARQGATGSNVGYQPIIYKTSNSGATWSLLSGIDFNSSQYAQVLNRITPVAGSTLTVPYFWANEGMDCTVDANGKLHFVSTIVGTPSTHLDSLDAYEPQTAEEYNWEFTPGKMPYIYDFIGDGTGAWSFVTVDSMTSQGPGDDAGEPGYNDNPWDADANFKPRSDARIQLSRTPDGKFIFYTWAESNPNFTAGSKNWNNIPEIKVRVMDVTGLGTLGAGMISPTKVNASAFGNNAAVSTRAMFHYASPVCSSYSYAATSVSVTLPLSITNSTPYSQLTSNTHWLCNAKLDFVISPVGVTEHVMDAASFDVFPNPAANTANVNIKLKESRKISLTVINALGQTISSQDVQANAGDNNVTLDVNKLVAGVYFINVNVDGTNFSKKLIKE